MKIKQSFIDRCGEITLKDLMGISRISKKSISGVMDVLSYPRECQYTTEILQSTATVLKIDLSDIYEVEQNHNTLTEKL